jgi:energy-coupling factor transport system ATP-binding protein
MDEAAQAQRVVVLHKGGIVLDGTPTEVFAQVDKLHAVGLAAPETVELCWQLNQKGFTLPLEQLNAEECAQTLYEALKV